jgi:hypothetical protein
VTDNGQPLATLSDGLAHPVIVSGEGTHNLQARATDAAGNVEDPATTATVKIDHTPPTTTATGIPSGWSTTPVTITLTASDGTDRSGVAAIHYSINGGSQTDVNGSTAPVRVEQDGVHTLRYWSNDNAGNSETVRTATIRMDISAPAIGISGGLFDRRDGQPIFEDEQPSVDVTAQDATSGVQSLEIQVDGTRVAFASQPCGSGGCSATLSYTLRANDTLDGEHVVTVISADYAGLTTRQSWRVHVARNPPDRPDESATDAAEREGSVDTSRGPTPETPADDSRVEGSSDGRMELECEQDDPHRIVDHIDYAIPASDPFGGTPVGMSTPELAVAQYLAAAVNLPVIPPSVFQLEASVGSVAVFTATVGGEVRARLVVVKVDTTGEWIGNGLFACSRFIDGYL